MIESENGITKIKGSLEELHCDLGCIFHLYLKEIHIPNFGREHAKERIGELVDIVLEQIDEEEE